MRQRKTHYVLGWLPVAGLVFSFWCTDGLAGKEPVLITEELEITGRSVDNWVLPKEGYPTLHRAVTNLANKAAARKAAGEVENDKFREVTILVENSGETKRLLDELEQIRASRESDDANEAELSTKAVEVASRILQSDRYAAVASVLRSPVSLGSPRYREFAAPAWLRTNHVREIGRVRRTASGYFKLPRSRDASPSIADAIHHLKTYFSVSVRNGITLRVTISPAGDREISYRFLHYHD